MTTKRPKRPRRRKRTRSNYNASNSDIDSRCDDDDISPATNTNTLYVPSHKKTKRSKPPSKEKATIIESTDSYIHIHSTVNKQRSKSKETMSLKFKMTVMEDGNIVLESQENTKRMKVCTAASINKHKKDVIEILLFHFFKYKCPTNVKLTKAQLLMILCGCCGIPLKNVDVLLAEFLTTPVKDRLCTFIKDQQMSLLIDVRNVARNNELLNVDGGFDDDYCALFFEADNILFDCLVFVWNRLWQMWSENQSEKVMIKQFYKLCQTIPEDDMLQQLEQHFSNIIVSNSWKRFSYGLLNSCYNHFIRLLAQEMTAIALQHAANKDVDSIDTKEKEYLVYSMANATCNSLLRKYYGFNFNKSNKCYLVTIVNAMLFQYKTLNEFIQNKYIPKRLRLENRGGLRMIREDFYGFSCSVVDAVTPFLHNMLLHNNNDIQSILDTVMQQIDENAFTSIFIIEDLSVLILQRLQQETKTNDMEEEEKEMMDVDEEKLQRYLSKVYVDLSRGITTRCIWSYLKKLKPSQDTLTLRAKLQIYHMSDKAKKSSLQTN